MENSSSFQKSKISGCLVAMTILICQKILKYAACIIINVLCYLKSMIEIAKARSGVMMYIGVCL